MRAAKRKILFETPLEPERVATIARRVPYFLRLPEDDQRELLGHLQVFLAEKNFEGCGGLEITDEIKLTIAAEACLLLLHRDTEYFPTLDSILVYPDEAPRGESKGRRIVDLPWDAVAKKSGEVGYRDASADDGRNVILHEFARQLDLEDGAANGVPRLAHAIARDSWVRVLEEELDEIANDADHGRTSDLDWSGVTNLADLFAIATEAFFEAPEKLAKDRPRLYSELLGFYKQDPLARLGITFDPPPVARKSEEEKSTPEAPLVLHTDITLNILRARSAAKLVGVSAPFREQVVALGCRASGCLSAIHKIPRVRGGTRLWAFVAEVFACPDPSVVAATYSLAGDGVAFWTMLDNGTIVDTETASGGLSLTRFFNRVSPRDRGEHAFFRAWAEPPAALYARHLDRVRQIAEREHATPIVRDPIELYAACRLHTADLFSVARAREGRLAVPIGGALLFLVGMVMLARFPPSNGLFALAMAAGFAVAAIFGQLVALVVEQMRVRIGPRSPDVLFAAVAERVRHRDVRGIAAIIHPKKRP